MCDGCGSEAIWRRTESLLTNVTVVPAVTVRFFGLAPLEVKVTVLAPVVLVFVVKLPVVLLLVKVALVFVPTVIFVLPVLTLVFDEQDAPSKARAIPAPVKERVRMRIVNVDELIEPEQPTTGCRRGSIRTAKPGVNQPRRRASWAFAAVDIRSGDHGGSKVK